MTHRHPCNSCKGCLEQDGIILMNERCHNIACSNTSFLFGVMHVLMMKLNCLNLHTCLDSLFLVYNCVQKVNRGKMECIISDGALKMVKCWTLVALCSCYFGYIVEGERPPIL